MIIEDCDNINAITLQGIKKKQSTIAVIGYNQKKVGGWDSQTICKIDFKKTEDSTSNLEEQKKIKETYDDSDESLEKTMKNSDNSEEESETDATSKGEEQWLLFQRQIKEQQERQKERDLQASQNYKSDDPFAMIMMKKKSKHQKNKSVHSEILPMNGLPNRYGIKPGIWWDGIDRSNGFERKRLAKQIDIETEKKDLYKEQVSRL